MAPSPLIAVHEVYDFMNPMTVDELDARVTSELHPASSIMAALARDEFLLQAADAPHASDNTLIRIRCGSHKKAAAVAGRNLTARGIERGGNASDLLFQASLTQELARHDYMIPTDSDIRAIRNLSYMHRSMLRRMLTWLRSDRHSIPGMGSNHLGIHTTLGHDHRHDHGGIAIRTVNLQTVLRASGLLVAPKGSKKHRDSMLGHFETVGYIWEITALANLSDQAEAVFIDLLLHRRTAFDAVHIWDLIAITHLLADKPAGIISAVKNVLEQTGGDDGLSRTKAVLKSHSAAAQARSDAQGA